MIENLQLNTDKKGKHSLDISVGRLVGLDANEVDETSFPKVALLIAQVQKAKAAFQFD